MSIDSLKRTAQLFSDRKLTIGSAVEITPSRDQLPDVRRGVRLYGRIESISTPAPARGPLDWAWSTITIEGCDKRFSLVEVTGYIAG